MDRHKTERQGFFKWYLTVLVDNYAKFSGRARREEYWMFVLFQTLLFALFIIIAALTEDYIDTSLISVLILVYGLGTLIPWLAVNARRLHDTGKSGGYFFINFIPVIGRIWYLVLMCTDGNHGSNSYGPDPKSKTQFDEIDNIGKPLEDL